MADLSTHAHRFTQKGVNLVVIGSGDPGHFHEFRRTTGYAGLLFTDPSVKSFAALGFSKGLMGIMNIKALGNAVSALKQGHRQGSVQGSTLQLGGAVIVDVSGKLRYYFAGARAGDHPGVEDLLNAI